MVWRLGCGGFAAWPVRVRVMDSEGIVVLSDVNPYMEQFNTFG